MIISRKKKGIFLPFGEKFRDAGYSEVTLSTAESSRDELGHAESVLQGFLPATADEYPFNESMCCLFKKAPRETPAISPVLLRLADIAGASSQ